ncbi:unnamed protein product, partial [Discosporangium mesarthrocarpum]
TYCFFTPATAPQMIFAKVLVGNYLTGESSMTVPPTRFGVTFNSTVDDEENPCIFATFRDFQSYPMYLVTAG